MIVIIYYYQTWSAITHYGNFYYDCPDFPSTWHPAIIGCGIFPYYLPGIPWGPCGTHIFSWSIRAINEEEFLSRTRNRGDDYRGRIEIFLNVYKDRPDRPIVQTVVIARFIWDDKMDDLQVDIRHGSSDHIGVD